MLVFFVGATMWTASPDAEPRQFAQASESSILPSSAGRTLGAASMCKEIPEARIDAAADGVSAMVDRGVRSNAEVDSARAAFRQGAADGRRAIASGASNCDRAAEDLAALERELRRQSR